MAVELCWLLMGNSKIPGGMRAARKQLSVALKGDIARRLLRNLEVGSLY